MDRLILLRHGRAEPDSKTGDDFDRTLTRGGVRQAAAAGASLADMGFQPDVALVSPAVRAMQTWEAASGAFAGARAEFESNLYHAEQGAIRWFAERAGRTHRTVMVVGHNPGLQDLAVTLLIEGSAPAGVIARVQRGFPTAAAAVFLFDNNGRPHFDGLFYPESDE